MQEKRSRRRNLKGQQGGASPSSRPKRVHRGAGDARCQKWSNKTKRKTVGKRKAGEGRRPTLKPARRVRGKGRGQAAPHHQQAQEAAATLRSPPPAVTRTARAATTRALAGRKERRRRRERERERIERTGQEHLLLKTSFLRRTKKPAGRKRVSWWTLIFWRSFGQLKIGQGSYRKRKDCAGSQWQSS